MKNRTPVLFLSLFLAVLALSACDAKSAPASTESIQPAVYIPQSSETQTTPLWDNTQSACDEKQLYMWRSAGTFSWRFSYPGYEDIATVTQGEPVYSLPSDDTCGWLSVGLGEIMKDAPIKGAQAEWTGSCEANTTRSTKTIVQQITVTVSDWEQKTTQLGTFKALRVKSLNQYADGTTPGIVEVNDWYVCGYGRIYSESTDTSTDIKYVDELLSFTPQSTNESHVRYILADMQLVNSADTYRTKVNDEETAESLRRWDAGIRVANIDQFERKMVNGQWQIVSAGSGQPVSGADVQLTSDLPQ